MSRARLASSILFAVTALLWTASAQTPSVPTSIDTAAEPTSIQGGAGPQASLAFPPCANSCLAKATTSLPCKETDSQCLCLHASTVQSVVKSCLEASGQCSAADTTSATLYYGNLCQSLGLSTGSDTSNPTAALVTATGATPASTASQSAASSAKASHSGGLSVPVIAGIAAGSALFVALLITIFVFAYIRRRASPDVVIVDNEKPLPPPKTSKPRSRPTSAIRPMSSRRSVLSFTLEPSTQSQNPFADNKRGFGHSTFEKTMSGSTLNAPSPASKLGLTNQSRTWYNKKEAEMSTTSLMSAPRNAHTPVPKSPAMTEFSDRASIYSATSTESDVSAMSNRQLSDILEPPSPITEEHGRGDKVVMSEHIFSPPKLSFSQPRASLRDGKPSSKTRAKPPPALNLSKPKPLKIETFEMDDKSRDKRITCNPLGQNPSPRTPTFTFELPTPEKDNFGSSFMNDLDKWKERK